MSEVLENETEINYLFARSDALTEETSRAKINTSTYKDLSVAFPTRKWHPKIDIEGTTQVIRGVRCAERLLNALIASHEKEEPASVDNAIMEMICVVYVDDPLIFPTDQADDFIELLNEIDPTAYFLITKPGTSPKEKTAQRKRVREYLNLTLKAIREAQPLPEVLGVPQTSSNTSIMEEMYTSEQAAAYLGVSKKTFSRYRKKHEIEPLPERPGNELLFRASDIHGISKKKDRP